MSMSRWDFQGYGPLASLVTDVDQAFEDWYHVEIGVAICQFAQNFGGLSAEKKLRRLFLSWSRYPWLPKPWEFVNFVQLFVRFDKHHVKICNKSRFFPWSSSRILPPADWSIISVSNSQRLTWGSQQGVVRVGWCVFFWRKRHFHGIFHKFSLHLETVRRFLLREEWRSCSEVTLNELWRYDIRGNKWEPDAKDRRATGNQCFDVFF